MNLPSVEQTLQAVPLQRARKVEWLEAQLGRCLTDGERTAFEIGYNSGMEAGLEEAKKVVMAMGGAL